MGMSSCPCVTASCMVARWAEERQRCPVHPSPQDPSGEQQARCLRQHVHRQDVICGMLDLTRGCSLTDISCSSTRFDGEAAEARQSEACVWGPRGALHNSGPPAAPGGRVWAVSAGVSSGAAETFSRLSVGPRQGLGGLGCGQCGGSCPWGQGSVGVSPCPSPCIPGPADGELHPAGRHHQGLLHGLLFPRCQAAGLALHPQPVWQWKPAGLGEVSPRAGQRGAQGT